MPKQPLENLSFRNLLMRVTGFVSVDGVKKTRGSLFDRPGGSWIMPTCLQPSFLPTYATWSCAGGGCCGTPRSLRGNATPSMPREWTACVWGISSGGSPSSAENWQRSVLMTFATLSSAAARQRRGQGFPGPERHQAGRDLAGEQQPVHRVPPDPARRDLRSRAMTGAIGD